MNPYESPPEADHATKLPEPTVKHSGCVANALTALIVFVVISIAVVIARVIVAAIINP